MVQKLISNLKLTCHPKLVQSDENLLWFMILEKMFVEVDPNRISTIWTMIQIYVHFSSSFQNFFCNVIQFFLGLINCKEIFQEFKISNDSNLIFFETPIFVKSIVIITIVKSIIADTFFYDFLPDLLDVRIGAVSLLYNQL